MKKRIIVLILTGIVFYSGYKAFIKESHQQDPEVVDTVTTLAKNLESSQELNMRPENIDLLDSFSEPTLQETNQKEQQLVTASASIIENAEEEITEVVTIEAPIFIQNPEPIKLPEIKKVTDLKVLPAKKQVNKKKQELTKKEKYDKLAKNLEGLQQQAAEEWEKMSTNERQVAEQQVEEFHHNFQQEIERLSKMSPEDVEREKNEALARLQYENPEAFQTVKSMEEMFIGLADASE